MRNFRAFVRLSRLHFLAGGFVMYGLGAFTSGGIDVRNYLLGQLMVTFAQLTAHYVNEYADYEADKKIVNRTAFSGGSGVLSSGELSPRVALEAAVATSGLTLGLVAVSSIVSMPAAVLGVIALGVSWAYSMPPLRLLSTGFGEIVTAITVTMIVPLIGLATQDGKASADFLLMTSVLFLLQMAMLVAFEIPDAETDAQSDKRVLAVRLGVTNTRTLVFACLAAAAALGFASTLTGTFDDEQTYALMLGAVPAVFLAAGIGSDAHTRTTLAAVTAFFLTSAGFLAAAI